jgi:nucleotide-binding universal stress UspA family protein
MKQIVIATDGSQAAKPALHEGFQIAAATGAKASVVHVPHHPSTILGTPYYDDAVGQASLDAEAVMLDARLTASRYDVDAEYEVIGGDPAAAIVDFARARDADMIVIGSRGLGAITGTVLGSVSRAVARQADRPVLIAKAKTRVLTTA